MPRTSGTRRAARGVPLPASPGVAASTRPDRDTYFMLMARTAALRGSCSRRAVGAIAVSVDHRVMGSGYNGAPPGVPHCRHDDDSPCYISDHAEWNAITHGGARGKTLYCTDGACRRCAELIVATGFQRFVYAIPFRDAAGVEWLSSKIEVIHWSPPAAWQALWDGLTKATSSNAKKTR